jgi:hypothetical protein
MTNINADFHNSPLEPGMLEYWKIGIMGLKTFYIFVIPGLARNPVFSRVPAGVCPVLNTGQE